MDFKDRITLIKQQPFPEAVQTLLPNEEIPTVDLPQKMLCLVHSEKTPSMFFHQDRWHCFGCGQGGDLIDLVQAYYAIDIGEAVERCEKVLGLVHDGADAEIARLVALAEAEQATSGPTKQQWERRVEAIADRFFYRMKPYLRSVDPWVQDLVWCRAEYVFEEIGQELMRVPLSVRGARQRESRLSRWVDGWSSSLEQLIARGLGKDRQTVLQQGPRVT